jgi:hypothetical protein
MGNLCLEIYQFLEIHKDQEIHQFPEAGRAAPLRQGFVEIDTTPTQIGITYLLRVADHRNGLLLYFSEFLCCYGCV